MDKNKIDYYVLTTDEGKVIAAIKISDNTYDKNLAMHKKLTVALKDEFSISDNGYVKLNRDYELDDVTMDQEITATIAPDAEILEPYTDYFYLSKVEVY